MTMKSLFFFVVILNLHTFAMKISIGPKQKDVTVEKLKACGYYKCAFKVIIDHKPHTLMIPKNEISVRLYKKPPNNKETSFDMLSNEFVHFQKAKNYGLPTAYISKYDKPAKVSDYPAKIKTLMQKETNKMQKKTGRTQPIVNADAKHVMVLNYIDAQDYHVINTSWNAGKSNIQCNNAFFDSLKVIKTGIDQVKKHNLTIHDFQMIQDTEGKLFLVDVHITKKTNFIDPIDLVNKLEKHCEKNKTKDENKRKHSNTATLSCLTLFIGTIIAYL